MSNRNFRASWDKVNPGTEAKERMLKKMQGERGEPARKQRAFPLRAAVSCCLLTGILLAVLAISQVPFRHSELSPQSVSQTEKPAAEDASSTGSAVTAETSVCWDIPTTSELAEDSSLILRGIVTGRSEPFRIQDGYGNVSNYVDYYVEPLETLRGDLLGAAQVSVRLLEPGAEVTALRDSIAQEGLQSGQEYLFFLVRHSAGQGIYAKGGYYSAVSGSSGIWTEDEGVYRSREENRTLEELKEQTAAFRDVPFDSSRERRELQDVYRGNFEEDVFTKEAYDSDMAMLDVFATVLDAAVGSADGDPRLALPRSFSMNARYVDVVPHPENYSPSISELKPWTEAERLAFFREEGRSVLLGTVERVDTVEFWSDAFPDARSCRTVLRLRVDDVLQNGENLGQSVNVLLPEVLCPGAGGNDPDPLFRLDAGMRGIFPVTLLSGSERLGEENAEDGSEPVLYLRDLADCTLDSHARGMVLETDTGLDFLVADYPARKSSATLEDFAVFLEFYLDSDRS